MKIVVEGTRLRERRTRIVATLGPASSSPERVRELLDAGVDVFRLNFSHGDHDSHARTYHAIREAAGERDDIVAVLADLSGPKIRVGTFPEGSVTLVEGADVVVTTRPVPGSEREIHTTYEGLPGDVAPGARILLADGLLEMRVETVDGPDVACSVVSGGVLGDRKGLNLPGTRVSAPAVTAKDRLDAAFAAELGVDWMALSFVSAASDVRALRDLLGSSGPRIMAKIERAEALDDIPAIVQEADGIMVARGDLGVELPPEEVPVAQRHLIVAARARGRPVVVATQMLESMVTQFQPTRAEVSDVSTAVFLSADAVMLSAETATGVAPRRPVEMMDRIARRVEGYQWDVGSFRVDEPVQTGRLPIIEAVARSLAQLSRDLQVRAIVAVTRSGASAAVVAAARPAAPVLAVTPDDVIARQLKMLWGVVPVTVADADLADAAGMARRLAMQRGLASAGEHVLLVSGLPRGDEPAEPTIKALMV